MILQGQAVVIPQFREFPSLMDGENFSTREVVSFTPFVNPFFRLEEKHGRSGEGQVIVPASEGQGEVDEEHVTLREPRAERRRSRSRSGRPKSLSHRW